jgi:hypothetical protein
MTLQQDTAILILAAAASLWGCAPPANGNSDGDAAPADANTLPDANLVSHDPDASVDAQPRDALTIAQNLLAQLQDEDYANTWAYLPRPACVADPAQCELYTPVVSAGHTSRQTAYVDDVTLDYMLDHLGAVPAGATIIKEEYHPTTLELSSLKVMHKVSGFNPADNDWLWFKATPEMEVAISNSTGEPVVGPLTGCINCHASDPPGDGNRLNVANDFFNSVTITQ